MLSMELRTKLDILENKLDEMETEYNTIDEQIQDLQEEQGKINCNITNTEIEIETLKKQIKIAEFDEINKDNIDPFLKDFIIASNFCNLEPSRVSLGCVSIEKERLIGIDGYKGIIIKNSNVPEDLKNSLIPWNIRESLKDNRLKDVQYLGVVDKIFDDAEASEIEIEGMTSNNFKERFKVEEYKKDTVPLYKLTIWKLKIYVNQEYLETCLSAMKDETFTVYADSPIKPMLFKSERIKAILLPVKMLKY